MDKLVEGPFGSNACYEQVIEQDGKEITTWMCFGSGFTSSTLMTEGSPALEAALSTSPELYKAIMHKDTKGHVWLPATITVPDSGMVFVDGTSKKDWKWAALPSIPLTDEDRAMEVNGRPKYPANVSTKPDMANIKHFEQNDFMEALDVIGFFALQ